MQLPREANTRREVMNEKETHKHTVPTVLERVVR